jgi:hypothetical protein
MRKPGFGNISKYFWTHSTFWRKGRGLGKLIWKVKGWFGTVSPTI